MSIPEDQEVKVGVSIYDTSNPEFSFPGGVSLKSYVYQIRVATTDESLISGIHIFLSNFPQPQNSDNLCVLEADTGLGGNLTSVHVFNFSEVKAPRFKYQERAVKVALRTSTCYLVIAGN